MLGGVVGWVQGFGVLFLAMSGTSESTVCVGQCCRMGSGVWGLDNTPLIFSHVNDNNNNNNEL